MTISRRRVLLQGGVIGAGVIATGLPGRLALAQGQGVPIRKSIHTLTWDDPIVRSLGNGVGLMKSIVADSPFNWASLANIHKQTCPHGNWYFLPWHRGYTVMYERLIRFMTGNDQFALPYWDWTTNPIPPAIFTSPTTPDGKTNTLFEPTRTWPATQPFPANVVGPAVLSQILGSPTYETFGTGMPAGQSDLDPSWIRRGTGARSVLEANPHNTVHNRLGGYMPTMLSPLDPIFLMHHGNIDRIWAQWNRTGGVNSTNMLWNNMRFTNNFWTAQMTPGYWSPLVWDLYYPSSLGYAYDGLPEQRQRDASPAIVALDNKLRGAFSAQGAVEGVTSYVAANTAGDIGVATKPLELTVTVDAARLGNVVRFKTAKKKSTKRELATAAAIAARREAKAAGPLVFAILREVTVTGADTTEFRVFVDLDGLSQQTPVSVPNNVGNFGVFNDHGGSHDKPSFLLDLTEALQRVHGNKAAPQGRIRVQILPVGLFPPAPTVGTVTVDRIEVLFIST